MTVMGNETQVTRRDGSSVPKRELTIDEPDGRYVNKIRVTAFGDPAERLRTVAPGDEVEAVVSPRSRSITRADGSEVWFTDLNLVTVRVAARPGAKAPGADRDKPF